MAYQDTIQVGAAEGPPRPHGADPRRSASPRQPAHARCASTSTRRSTRSSTRCRPGSATRSRGRRLPPARLRDDPQGDGPEHQLGRRLHAADDHGPDPPAAPPHRSASSASRRRSTAGSTAPSDRPDRPGPGDRDRQAPARPQGLRLAPTSTAARASHLLMQAADDLARHRRRPQPASPSSTRPPWPTRTARHCGPRPRSCRRRSRRLTPGGRPSR